jgi:hypothetical protein
MSETEEELIRKYNVLCSAIRSEQTLMKFDNESNRPSSTNGLRKQLLEIGEQIYKINRGLYNTLEKFW